jgi:hypothetical protein
MSSRKKHGNRLNTEFGENREGAEKREARI